MNESNAPGEDRKIKVKPRGLKAPEAEAAHDAVPPPPKITSSLETKGQPSGMPFEARARSRQRSQEETGHAAAPGLVAKTTQVAATGQKEPAPAPQNPAPSQSDPVSSRKQSPGTLRWLARMARKRIGLGRAALITLPVAGFAAWGAYAAGGAVERAAALQAAAKRGVIIPDDVQARLDAALAELRAGNAPKALDALGPIEQENPDVASLTYLVALAAMQAGETDLSEKKTDESIAKRERVSDSLALKAVLETQKTLRGFGDPAIRSEAYLRRAMAADAANPHPIIELATLLRYKNRDEEAAKLLAAAKSRLNPVDSHAVVETSLSLMNLQLRSDADLPENLDPDKDIASLFSAAYVAMRKGDYERAAKILHLGKERLPADFFDYLVNDPALRKFSSRPGLQEFYE